MLLIRGNCAGKQNNIEKTIKTGTGERLENGEWVREDKLSCSISKQRKMMVLWLFVELSCKTPWHNMQANHKFWRNTKKSWQFWCWYKWQDLRWEALAICRSTPSWQKSNCRIKACKQKWGCRLGKEAGTWELVLLMLELGRYCSADHFVLFLAGKKGWPRSTTALWNYDCYMPPAYLTDERDPKRTITKLS